MYQDGRTIELATTVVYNNLNTFSMIFGVTYRGVIE